MMTIQKAAALVSCLAAGCNPKASDRDKSKDKLPDQFDTALQKWREVDQKKGELADKNERNVADLRRALAADWSHVIVSLRYDCSCTGTSYKGFRISRDGDTYSVAPWAEASGWPPTKNMDRTGAPRTLAGSEIDRLLSEAALFYLSASLSVAPLEKVGPPPPDTSQLAAWRERYLAAGACPLASDRHWIDIRVATPDGLKRYENMWDRRNPADFSTWVASFGTLPL